MSEHLASMNEQITSQNDKIDKLQQQLHTSKVLIKIIYFYYSSNDQFLFFKYRMGKKAENEMNFPFIAKKNKQH